MRHTKLILSLSQGVKDFKGGVVCLTLPFRSWSEQALKSMGTAQQSLLVGNFLSFKHSMHAKQGAHPHLKLCYDLERNSDLTR